MAKILVVDDERFLREDIADVLMLEGYDVSTAANGQEGVETARRIKPDLIICDIAMPELDGYQVLLQLRQDATTALIPFIFVTARAERSDMRQGMQLGADDYLTKPFTNDELLTAIRARLQKRQLAKEVTLHELDTAKQQLAQMVAHELRTPLMSVSTVQNLLEMSLDTFSQGEVQELVGIMRSGTQRLNHLVEQMVFLVRVQTGLISHDAIAANAARTPIWSVMVAATNAARQFARRNPNGQIRMVEDARETEIAAHVQALTHALSEIFTNALDFSTEDSEVRVEQWFEDGFVQIKIMDMGPGIAEERISQALQPFEQIDRERYEQQGMGIGLYLADSIIKAHNGEMAIQSQVGYGTTVWIRLPVAPKR